MASEWPLHSVSALIERGALVVGDGYRAKNEELSNSGLPFARAGNINNGFRFDDADYFPEDNIERVGNKVSQLGDVVFTSKGTVGRFAFVQSATPRFVYSPQLCFWRSLDPGLIDPRFLFFWMFGREFFVQFKGVAGQTDMAEYVSLTDQRRMHITLPPLPEQRAIAHILGTLDDKIELNRRMNETLEAMARALFQGMMTKGTGMKDWRIERLGDLIELAYGKALKEEDRRPGNVCVVGSNGQVGWHDKALVKGPGIVIGRKGNPGIVTWSHMDFFPIDTTFYVVPKGEYRSLYFLYYALRNQDLPSLSADSAVPGLNRNMAYQSKQVVPPHDHLKAFDKQVCPLFERIHHNNEESRTLAKLRDALLPKLLSGEVRVNRGEKIVEGVA